jgi:hypothetical protein
LPLNPKTVQLALEADLTGHVLAGSDTWLTAGFDQLSANPALSWSSVRTRQAHAAVAAHEACAWAGAALLSTPDVTAFELRGRSKVTGTSVRLAVSVAAGRPETLHVHFACNSAGVLQSVQFDCVLHDASSNHVVTKRADILLDVTWDIASD